MIDYEKIPSPCYVVDECALRRNLTLIRSVKERARVEIILAFKAFALWKLFPIVREYIPYSTASSLSEARLAYEEMGNKAHTYSPAYTDVEFDAIADCSSHITFNSITQYQRFAQRAKERGISCGLRINPEFSDVETDLYNPCAAGSRLGVVVDSLGDKLPFGIEGLHFHTLCESSSYDLERTLAVVEEKFGRFFSKSTRRSAPKSLVTSTKTCRFKSSNPARAKKSPSSSKRCRPTTASTFSTKSAKTRWPRFFRSFRRKTAKTSSFCKVTKTTRAAPKCRPTSSVFTKA